jgi:hypothetical protein
VNRFIGHSQAVTTNNCNSIADFKTKNYSTLTLLSLFALVFLGNSSPQWIILCRVFTRSLLVTSLSNGDSSATVARRLTLHNWTLNSSQLTWTTRFGTRLSYNHFTRTANKTQPVSLTTPVFTALLPSKKVLLFRACVSAGMYLATICLAMGIKVTI